ncbi:D-glycero-beta-D-manno-heptose 1-phosphate adenylyltransferase [Synechococcus sp. CBW1002]|uniref:D-glycero-beta-D-manno-heptose 1-phosphate adenylyltransferase n=1 Tax=Synechococcus sp. CBW1002 TaxID=1353134 RepID=UPI0018CDDF3B|nr:D-glycero-beta-D-manno-heptose 1-phosphate adenylyltransferase [Synechococcus sp. CBW1002]QPN59142.1 D-glycero-beta-D-manno-heptose 1-phosphate adenylyltransferase [Synechococcus sp. CBW1002]
MDYKALVPLVQQFRDARVLCLGDLILDTFNHGSVERISPERPVPVFRPGQVVHIPGGAANVARNITSLGGHCSLVGLAGHDEASSILHDLLQSDARISCNLVFSERPTCHKVRFTAAGQHLMRLDNETNDPIGNVEIQRVLSLLEPLLPGHDVLILSDYAKGLLCPDLLQQVIAMARRFRIPVVVDPKSPDFNSYAGASLLTPNTVEAERATGFPIHTTEDAERAGLRLLNESGVSAVLITRGAHGMSLVLDDAPPLHLASGALEVFDVVGAGDTVIATLACVLAAGGSYGEAASTANVAAGLVVAKPDTATVAPGELINRLMSLSACRPRPGDPLLLKASQLLAYVATCRAEGKRIGFTNGVFDLVHPGHVSLLRFARDQCDVLIVGINSDASVRRLGKGDERPINSEDDRAAVLGAFGMVDATVIFDDDTPLTLIELIRPDVLIKGADYTIETVVGSSLVLGYGGDVVLAPIESGKSSTRMIAKARRKTS